MREIDTSWMQLLLVLLVGFIAGRMTASVRLRGGDGGVRGMRGQQTGLSPSRETAAAVTALLAEGNKIDAIKRVRRDLGIGLQEAKELVDDWPRSAP